jgi:ESCRT-II complex subunit VPS22
MRRGAGLSGLQKKNEHASSLAAVGAHLAAARRADLLEQLETFKASLAAFAAHHKERLRADPPLRAHFHSLCVSVGVDPLLSSKGLWSSLGLGEYYFDLAVRAAEVCMATRKVNGGVMPVAELAGILSQSTRSQITEDDVIRSIEALTAGLGNGYSVKRIPGPPPTALIISTAGPMAEDQVVLLGSLYSSPTSSIDPSCQPAWSRDRFDEAVGCLVREGIVWVDDPQEDGQSIHYFSFPRFISKF